MTPEDIEFVRKIYNDVKQTQHGYHQGWSEIAVRMTKNCDRLLTLLVRAEARGDEAEFWDKRPFIRKEKPEQVNWSDSDWVRSVRERSVRERWGLE